MFFRLHKVTSELISKRLSKYPSCDHLNNALRFLLIDSHNTSYSIKEICFAIYKAGGYFHDDVKQQLKELNIPEGWWEE